MGTLVMLKLFYTNTLYMMALRHVIEDPALQQIILSKFAVAIALVLTQGIAAGITLDIPLGYVFLECEEAVFNSEAFQELITSQAFFNMRDFISATNLSDRIVGMIFAEIDVNVIYRSAHIWGGPAWLEDHLPQFTEVDSATTPALPSRPVPSPSRLMWADSVIKAPAFKEEELFV